MVAARFLGLLPDPALGDAIPPQYAGKDLQSVGIPTLSRNGSPAQSESDDEGSAMVI